MRQAILDELETLLAQLPDFNGVLVWDNVPAEYSQNAIYIKDCRERYEKRNVKYVATLRIEIVAIVVETSQLNASELGNIALVNLINAVKQLSVECAIASIVDSHKWIETKGKTACEVELNIDVKYQF
jgi:hypothetical protein